MNYISLLIGGVTALFIFWGVDLLLNYKRTGNPDLCKLLGYITLFWSIAFLKDCFNELYSFQYLNLSYGIDLLTIPVASLYVFEITKPHWLNPVKAIHMIFPSVLMLLVYSFLLITDNPSRTPFFFIFVLYTIVYIIVMMVFVVHRVRSYNKMIQNNFSFDSNIDLSWINIVFLLFFSDCLLFFFSIIWPYDIFNFLYYILIAASWWILYRNTIQQKDIFNLNEDILSEEMVNNPLIETKLEVKSKVFDMIGKNLEKLVEEKKIYLNPDLNLSDLAKQIGTNKTYLYLYLKQVKQTSFSNYINSLRITLETTRLLETMTDEHPYSINEISTMAGFQSISTFRRAFYNQYGCTATAYLKRLQEKKGKAKS